MRRADMENANVVARSEKMLKTMVMGEFEKIISEISILKVVVGDHHFAEACTTSFPFIQPQNEPLLFTDFGTEGINNSLTIYSVPSLNSFLQC